MGFWKTDHLLTGYSMQDLVEHTGLDRRTIRSFIEQKLMTGPEKGGRYAQYSESQRARLLAIKALRERGLSSVEIREALLRMTEEQVHAFATSRISQASPDIPQSSSSALDYLRSIQMITDSDRTNTSIDASSAILGEGISLNRRVASSEEPSVHDYFAHPGRTGPKATPIDQLLMELGKLFEERVPKGAKGEAWFRISITPDFELSIRGVQNEEQLARLERIADYLRTILLGGLK